MTLMGHAQHSLVYNSGTDVATSFAIGHTNNLDTYLSPIEKYRGIGARFLSEVTRDSNKSPLTYNLSHEASIDYTTNRHGNGHEYSAHYDFSYAVMRRWSLLDNRLTIRGGAIAEAYLGGCYNARSSANNPAQGYASASIGVITIANYKVRLLGRMSTVSYEGRMPMVGMMFSPNYGQSYYEIFKNGDGDCDHNIVMTTIAPVQARQQLTIDYPLNGRKSIRLGYICDIRQAKPNNLKQHKYYNAFMIGWVIRK